jgi:hypothetical protein
MMLGWARSLPAEDLGTNHSKSTVLRMSPARSHHVRIQAHWRYHSRAFCTLHDMFMFMGALEQ